MKEAAAEDCGSAIRQAFLAALQKELASLYQLMAQLDALAGHPLPAGEAGMSCKDIQLHHHPCDGTAGRRFRMVAQRVGDCATG